MMRANLQPAQPNDRGHILRGASLRQTILSLDVSFLDLKARDLGLIHTPF